MTGWWVTSLCPTTSTTQSQGSKPVHPSRTCCAGMAAFCIRWRLCIRSLLPKRRHLRLRLCSVKFRSRHQAETGSMTGWGSSDWAPRLFRTKSENLELLAPFGRQIAEAFDADAAGQTTFDGRFDQIRR